MHMCFASDNKCMILIQKCLYNSPSLTVCDGGQVGIGQCWLTSRLQWMRLSLQMGSGLAKIEHLASESSCYMYSHLNRQFIMYHFTLIISLIVTYYHAAYVIPINVHNTNYISCRIIMYTLSHALSD